MDPPSFQRFFEHFQQPIIWLRSGWKHSKISDCIQTAQAIDCATAPIFPRGPTDTVRFDDCGSARSEQGLTEYGFLAISGPEYGYNPEYGAEYSSTIVH